MGEKKTTSEAIGIDLGTTYSCVSVWRNNRAEIIQNDQENRTTPSFVAFGSKEILKGDKAKDYSIIDHKNTVFDSKRLIGRRYHDKEVQEDMKHWPFDILEREGKIVYKVKMKDEITYFTPEEISSEILVHLKETAEAFLGRPVKDAVITVPAYFNNSQRQSTINAGTMAGLNVLSILNEPTAAALAYGVRKHKFIKRKVLVVDLGGGTFDVSLLEIHDKNFYVLATSGNPHLGGNDFDTRLMNHLVQEFKTKTGHDVSDNHYSRSRLRAQSEYVKCKLSSQEKASVDIGLLYSGIDFQTEMTRDMFEELCKDLFSEITVCIRQVLNDTSSSPESVDKIIMVGGSTRICKVRRTVSEFFNGRTLDILINPEVAVAIGASIFAATFSSSCSNAIKRLSLIDVTPLSLGIETGEEKHHIVVPRNTKLPFSVTGEFTTIYDKQTAVCFAVYEGEKKHSRSNHYLGSFNLYGIPPAEQGIPKLDVTFTIDTNGILNVKAYNYESGNSKDIDIVYKVNQHRQNEDAKIKVKETLSSESEIL